VSAPSLPPESPPSVWRMYRAMVGVGLVCGVLIVSVFQLTRPIVERKQAEALQRAIFEVLPNARSSRTFRAAADGSFEALTAAPEADDELVYAGYDADGRLVGLAVQAEGMGYQDVIRVLYGYSFREQAIIGIRILESRETPGLGDRIESDPAFRANFERLDVALAADGAGLAHPIVVVKHGQKQHPWEVDGITGATISSTAIADLLRASTAHWIPRLRPRLDDFREAP
jgi:electron transport complex protein RnfG